MEECKMIQELTGLFRTSTDPFWILLRRLVRERGIDPDTSLLADSFEDDVNFEFGILVTDDRRVIQYGVRYSDPSFKDGKLTEWKDITELWSSSPYRREVSDALSANQISKTIRAELSKIKNPKVLEVIRKLLVSPRCEARPWDYGEPDAKYPCWIFAEHQASNTAFAYCEQGFGPRCPWGLLWISGEYLNMGMDSSWFSSLEDLVKDSRAWPDEEQKP
jgi:hypothetical protein